MLESSLMFIGFIAGLFGSLLGLGGGIIIVPALLGLSHYSSEFSMITPAVAVGTSLVLILLGSFFSTLTYIRQKKINFKTGILFFLGCSPGAFCGSYLTIYVQSSSFYIGFGLMILFLSIMLELKNRATVDIHKEMKLSVGLTFLVSFVVGVISGLFGLGGGVLLLPFMLFSGFPIHVATSTSVFIIFLSSFTGALTHFYMQDIDWQAVLFLGPGMITGGMLGAWLSPRIKNATLFLFLRIVLLLLAIQFIWKGIADRL